MFFKKIDVCLDMFGCPNRCKHCWIGHSSNGNLNIADLRFVADQFRPFTKELLVTDWYREPDYRDDYKELWDLCNELSDTKRTHFELISVWRIVRDREYVDWLSSLGVKRAQLTIFGGQEKTDYYFGRKNAYKELLDAIEILIDHKISPRLQFFMNRDNLGELPFVDELIRRLKLAERCKSFDGEFSFFLHQGSCEGENEKLYDVRVTPSDLNLIPPSLLDYTLKHFSTTDMSDVFGKPERELYMELLSDHSTASYVTDTPVFYVDKEFNVYPNITAPEPAWVLGNLRVDGAQTVLKNYLESKSLAQNTRLTVPLCKILEAVGDQYSERLFSRGDYIIYLLNKYCRA